MPEEIRLLLNAKAGELLEGGTTPVLLTPREVDVSLSERAKGGVVILSAATQLGRAMFRFEEGGEQAIDAE